MEKFISEGDVDFDDSDFAKVYIPSAWNGFETKNGKRISHLGYASYWKKVVLKKEDLFSKTGKKLEFG